METIGNAISRVRGSVKAVKSDAFITDRYIYSIILKYAKTFIKRLDDKGKVYFIRNLFKTIPCVELVEVDKVDACCEGISSDCTIRRTKDPLPKIVDGYDGPIIRSIFSLDYSMSVQPTWLEQYIAIANSGNFKYNKTHYYWLRDGYAYFPDVEWEAVNIEAIWEGNITYFQCDTKNKCKIMQELESPIPDHLFSEIEQQVLNEINLMIRIPLEIQDDKQNILRNS